MASSQVFSPVAPAVFPQTSYAGFDRRVAAHLIDALIALAVMMAAGISMRWLRDLGFLTVPGARAGWDPVRLWRSMGAGDKVAIIVCFIVLMGPFYQGLLQASAWQATIGKRLVKIYVTDAAGRRLGLGRSLARSFAKDSFVVFYPLAFVNVVVMITSANRQALHDFVAKTVVLRGRPSESGSPELWRFIAGFGIPSLWYILTMLAVLRTLR